jgi:hypothetical protein
MRLPKRLRHGVIAGGAIRQHGKGAMRQAGIPFQPTRCRIGCRRTQPKRGAKAKIPKRGGKADQGQEMEHRRQPGQQPGESQSQKGPQHSKWRPKRAPSALPPKRQTRKAELDAQGN